MQETFEKVFCMQNLIGHIFCDTLSSWLWSRIENYLKDGQLQGEGHPEPLVAELHLQSQQLVSLEPRILCGDYRRERKALSRHNHR